MNRANKPKILAPAGDKNSFLAAIAAGADAVYCGLKIFSARMEARNFSTEELSRLNALARSRNVQLYVALNSLIKQNELEKSARVIAKLAKYVRPHALILQDPGLVDVARRSGFKGELHLSTLANCSFPMGLEAAEKAGFSRVVLPRELNIDEIKMMASAAPPQLELEIFIHGALCYAVSGRCYWSSWFGGRSGLRGRCVQPCRRMYKQGNKERNKNEGGKESKESNNSGRYFSCLDFSVDVLAKVLKEIPEVTTWKIEGRKKSPHYVFYTVKAYKMLRDHGHDPAKKKIALSFLEYAMGRPTTHYNLLSQRPQSPLNKDFETGSGLFAGRVKYGEKPHFITRELLLKDDLLRIGYEDDPFHTVQRVTRSVPKKGTLVLQKVRGGKFKKGTPVFIVDRREKEVWELILDLENDLEKYRSPDIRPQEVNLNLDVGCPDVRNTPTPKKKIGGYCTSVNLTLHGFGDESKIKSKSSTVEKKGLWLSEASVQRCSPGKIKDVWWFLPPVIWPGHQDKLIRNISETLEAGARNFVLNMPWQIACFKQSEQNKLNLWAGPFCNVSNSAHIYFLKRAGFSGAFVSPEIEGVDLLSLPIRSTLPLGIITKGNWPLAISRTVSEDILQDQFFTSPRGEHAWVTKKENDFWIYPNWILDLSMKKEELQHAGYSLFLTIDEPLPKEITLKKRPGLWNWEVGLL